jgi:hypothetical protein
MKKKCLIEGCNSNKILAPSRRGSTGSSPLTDPVVQNYRSKCGRPHLVRNVASAFMWRPTPLAPFDAANRTLNAT